MSAAIFHVVNVEAKPEGNEVYVTAQFHNGHAWTMALNRAQALQLSSELESVYQRMIKPTAKENERD